MLLGASLCLPGYSFGQKLYRGAEYRTIAAMTYGRFETRMKSANVTGMLSSFFTYYDTASPWNEIDIENLGRYTNQSQFNVIVPVQDSNHVYSATLGFNPHAAFHTYSIDWTPDYIAWRIDGDEVYRQTGPHVAKVIYAQKLMMNIWQPNYPDWVGTFDPTSLPVYAYYDWVKYYSYTPGVNDDFTLQWTDDMTSFDSARWQKATHTWDGNNCQFVTANAVLRDGYLILCMTNSSTSGYGGGTIVDTDVDAPFPISAFAYDSTIVVRFSEVVSQATAEDVSHYSGGSGITYKSAALRSDDRTVDISVSGMDLSSSFTLSMQGIQDVASSPNTMASKSIAVRMPLTLPIRIDVGATTSTYGYLPDSVWNGNARYGRVGGVVRTLSATVSNTGLPVLYSTVVHGLGGYKVRVPNGTYDVTLKMSEDRMVGAGKRVFSATVEGDTIFTDLDIYQNAGFYQAYDVVLRSVKVTDNILDFTFISSVDSTSLSALVVERVDNTVGVKEASRTPDTWSLSIYPNPCNASAVVRYTVATTDPVSFDVFDVLGRRVSTTDLGTMAAGVHEYHWNAERLASGAYFCTIRNAHHSTTKPLLIVR